VEASSGSPVAHINERMIADALIEAGLVTGSVYECGRFTCTIKQHLGQIPPKHVAGLPTQVMNDKGRYRQHRKTASA
jgi:hypothetical protein